MACEIDDCVVAQTIPPLKRNVINAEAIAAGGHGGEELAQLAGETCGA